eukprot:463554-Amphidinium_carterae.1
MRDLLLCHTCWHLAFVRVRAILQLAAPETKTNLNRGACCIVACSATTRQCTCTLLVLLRLSSWQGSGQPWRNQLEG